MILKWHESGRAKLSVPLFAAPAGSSLESYLDQVCTQAETLTRERLVSELQGSHADIEPASLGDLRMSWRERWLGRELPEIY